MNRPHHISSRLFALLFLSALPLALFGCDTDTHETVDYEERQLDPPLSAEQVSAIKSVPTTSFSLSDVVLPNGRTAAEFLQQYGRLGEEAAPSRQSPFSLAAVGPQTQKNLIIAEMTKRGMVLTNPSNFTYPEEPPIDGAERPAQEGLAYSYGQKDHTVREVPPNGDCDQAAIYGLDCSGFISDLSLAIGIDLRNEAGNTWANRQRQPSTWNSVFSELGLDKLRAKDLGQLNSEALEAGDIVYWFGYANNPDYASHIGIVLEKPNEGLALFHAPGWVSQKCKQNYGPSLGPKQSSLDDPYWFGGGAGEWGVVRITTDISGEWQLYGRCQDQSEDAFSLPITITSEAEQEIAASGSGTDYDGSPLEVSMDGTYVKATNMLSAEVNFSFPDTGGNRTDSFERRLNLDDTGYFPATLEFHSGDGCSLAVRLVNQETAPLPVASPSSSGSTGSGVISE